jgi:uncharacterized protein
VFGEYDPVTGERLSWGDRLLAGGNLLLTFIPPAKGAGVAGKAAIKGAKAAADVSKLVSQTRHVLRYDKIVPTLQAVYHQVVKAPITQTIRSFKQQWETTSQKCWLCPTGIVASRRWSWSGVKWTDDRNRG